MNDQELIKDSRNKKKRKTIKTAVLVIVIIALLTVLFITCTNRLSNSLNRQLTTELVQLETKIREEIYVSNIDISGSLEAYQTQNVVTKAQGTISAVYVKEGDSVKKGDLIAELEDSEQLYSVEDAKRNLEKAKIVGNSSARDLDLLEKKLKIAEQNLEKTKCYANFNGVVVSVKANVDDYAQAGTTVATVIDNTKLKAKVEVDEIDAQLLDISTKAVLSSDALPGVYFDGYVSYIPLVGRYSNNGIGVLDVEIEIPNPPERLKSGFSFNGIISVESENAMLLVTQDAVTTRSGNSYVTKKLSDGSTEEVQVQVKYLGENTYQILSGNVSPDDTLVYTTKSSVSNMFFTQPQSRNTSRSSMVR